MIEQVILHNLVAQEEWRCAWEAVGMFRSHDGKERYGRDQGMTYAFDSPTGEDIRIGVWRSKHGINAARVD